MVDLRLLANKYFGSACLIIFFVGFTLYGASTLLPLLLQSEFGYDATLAGLVLSPSGLIVIFLMPIAGKLVNKFQAKYLIAFGMAMTSIGMFSTMFFTPATDYHTFVMFRMLQVCGLPFMFVPTGTLAFSAIPKEKSGKASALYSLMRNLGGSFGISLALSYLSRHEQMHQTYLSQHLAATDPAYQAALAGGTQAVMNLGQPHAAAAVTAMGRIYQQLVIQSTILSYSDVYEVFAVLTGTLAIVALFMPRNKIIKKTSPDDIVPAH